MGGFADIRLSGLVRFVVAAKRSFGWSCWMWLVMLRLL